MKQPTKFLTLEIHVDKEPRYKLGFQVDPDHVAGIVGIFRKYISNALLEVKGFTLMTNDETD